MTKLKKLRRREEQAVRRKLGVVPVRAPAKRPEQPSVDPDSPAAALRATIRTSTARLRALKSYRRTPGIAAGIEEQKTIIAGALRELRRLGVE